GDRRGGHRACDGDALAAVLRRRAVVCAIIRIASIVSVVPYTTLFRSVGEAGMGEAGGGAGEDLRAAGAGGGDGAGGVDERVRVRAGQAAARVGEAGPVERDLGDSGRGR